eukprot:CAMPEP_0172188766 /NCGR_PEP_ID=MMETSP1050-20130122/22137_1 /TAXON_ID=233186 /ORGANISM="Cryptomonas curvata, Strain CCAP979/52" /LENGTH=83 /DNA_ID=CAMNT_0012863359 /DNA_START=211 /DNA_END=462 /DNA_ORIENTATION=-
MGQFEVLVQAKKKPETTEQISSGFADRSGAGKYAKGHFPKPAYPSVNVICSGYCDARSPAPKGLAALGMPPNKANALKDKYGI